MSVVSDDLFYATPDLNRQAHLRRHEKEILALQDTQQSRYILVHQNRNLFRKEDDFLQPAFLPYLPVSSFVDEAPCAYLGQSQGEEIFVLDLSEHEEEKILSSLGNSLVFEDLRRAGPLSQRQQASQMAYARGLMFWHSRHLFCGACGHETQSREAGHVRHCLNPDCSLDHFPRTDPAVIMLVHDGDTCLLARHTRLREGMYSTLAGFLEPGETLEQAVRREVMEETGVQVGEVRYAGSQPWPFPTSLMVGFYAQAESRAIQLDEEELSDAQWFSREDLLNFHEQGKSLPSKDSIARNLIECWLSNT